MRSRWLPTWSAAGLLGCGELSMKTIFGIFGALWVAAVYTIVATDAVGVAMLQPARPAAGIVAWVGVMAVGFGIVRAEMKRRPTL